MKNDELYRDHDQQVEHVKQMAYVKLDAKAKVEKAEGVVREGNFVKPICDAVRHRHHKQLRRLLGQDRLSSAQGFYRGVTPLHAAAEHDNALAVAELLQQAGTQLILRSWYDPASVFEWLVQRKAGLKKPKSVAGPGGEEEDGSGVDDPDAQNVPLAMIAQLAVDAAVPSSSMLELEFIQPRIYDLIASRATFTDTGVSRLWFESWWPKARPIRSPLWIAASLGYDETVDAMLTECDKQAMIGKGMSWCDCRLFFRLFLTVL